MALTPHSAHRDGFTALKSGTVLERYRIESVIAAGGFGITYVCRHATLNKLYALKEHFPRQFAYREGSTSQVRSTDGKTFSWALDRFLEEGRSLAKCAHPGVVSVTDVFEANNTAYMVLDYEQGSSFKDWLTELGRPPNQDEIDAILEPLLDALEYVHSQGMLHRDIAPDNIVVRSDGSPCLIDFGSARQAVAERSEMMSAIVKNGFSPPEQYTSSGKSQGPWSDIYALAATLYRAISGKMPREAPERQIDDELLPIAEAVENPQDYRRGFLEGIDQAMRLRPSERPQNVSEWRKLLYGATKGSPTAATEGVAPKNVSSASSRETRIPEVAKAKTAKGNREHRSSSAAVWLGALAVALIVAGGGYAYRSSLHNQEPLAIGASLPDAPNPAQPADRQSSVRQQQITPPTAAPGQPLREARTAAPPVVASVPGAPSSHTRGGETQTSQTPTTTRTATREGTSEGGAARVETGAGTAAIPATEPQTESEQTDTRTGVVPRPESGQTIAPPSASATKLAPASKPPPIASEVTAPDKAAAVAAPSLPPMRSIEELVASLPAFSPIEGLPEAQWKQSCASCHKWTKEALCKQGQTYAKAPEKLGRHPHPLGGEFKTKLKVWAETGCT